MADMDRTEVQMWHPHLDNFGNDFESVLTLELQSIYFYPEKHRQTGGIND